MHNYKTVQRKLDIAAEELEQKGFEDLADKVDLCNIKLEEATPAEQTVILSVLNKINKEADLRLGKKTVAKGAKNPLQQSAVRRRQALRKRIADKIAARKLEKALLAGLELTEEASSERNEDAMRQWRKDRLHEEARKLAKEKLGE